MKKLFPCLLWCVLTMRTCQTNTSRPHIIFILADDLGWHDVGFHGMRDISTPNIDALAANALILNNYYVAMSCTPSRSALLSGLNPSRIGAQNVLNPQLSWGLPLNVNLMPEHLARLGYKNSIIGKWHIGHYRKEFTPTYRGFDYHYGTWYGAVDFWTKRADEVIANSSDLAGVPHSVAGQRVVFDGFDFRENMAVVTDETGQYMTDVYTQKAIEMIHNHNTNKPLFLLLSHHAVHKGSINIDHEAPAKYVAPFAHIRDKQRRQFAGALTALDSSVGQVVKALYRKGMLKDSIVVFSTDNGADLMSVAVNGGSNWPLRGQKQTVWEGGIRGVGLVWTANLEPRIWQGMMHITDWLPTLYSAAGGDVSDLGSVDGMNVWPSFLSSALLSPRHDFLVHHDPVLNYGAFRSGHYKLVYGRNFVSDMNSEWLSSSYSTCNPDDGGVCIAKKHSTVAKVLEKLYLSIGRKIQTDVPQVVISCGVRINGLWNECDPACSPCLFNVNDDPCEYRNLATIHPEVVQEMLRKLETHTRDAFPPPTHPEDYDANPHFYGGLWVPWHDTEYKQIRKQFTSI